MEVTDLGGQSGGCLVQLMDACNPEPTNGEGASTNVPGASEAKSCCA